MKRLLSTILTAAFASVSFAQTDISGMTNDELYMKMKSDEVLQKMYFDACNDISKNIQLQEKEKAITDPINNERNALLTKIADSLGVKVDDAAGTPQNYKIYNPGVDTAAVIKFLELREPIDTKYSAIFMAATADLRAQYNQMVMDAFAEAAKKYYDNLARMSK